MDDTNPGHSVINVLLADDQPMMAMALKTILDSQQDIDVVATAGDGREAVEQARKFTIDIAVLDIRMPYLNGIEAARLIKDSVPGARILMLTTFDDENLVRQALDVGVQGFLLKDSGPDVLIDAVRKVHAGASVLSPAVTEFVIKGFRGSRPPDLPATALHANVDYEQLTCREKDILARVALAESNAEIAAHLHVGLSTVKTYISRLIAKLQVRDRVGLAVWAYQAGVVRHD